MVKGVFLIFGHVMQIITFKIVCYNTESEKGALGLQSPAWMLQRATLNFKQL